MEEFYDNEEDCIKTVDTQYFDREDDGVEVKEESAYKVVVLYLLWARCKYNVDCISCSRKMFHQALPSFML